mgnify:CR=1 FL=1
MSELVISKEVANQEIEKWLDHKKVSDNKREASAESIELLADAVSSGNMILDKDFNLVYKLKFPTEAEAPITELKFKPRLKIGTVYNHLQNVKPSDADGRLFAYAAALTTNSKEVIKSLEIDDWNIVQAVVIFFL